MSEPLLGRLSHSIIDVAAAGQALGDHGEGQESGDLHLVAPFDGGALVAVMDGLGHGRDAAAASRAAADVLMASPTESVVTLMQRCHEALHRTRGAVMSLVSFNAARSEMTWIGVGNVESALFRASPGAGRPREVVVNRAGVVGYRLPPLRAATLSIGRGDTLIMVTDGIRSQFASNLALDRGPDEIADGILARHNKKTDDALVLVARYLGDTP